jgi:hypothetical protein
MVASMTASARQSPLPRKDFHAMSTIAKDGIEIYDQDWGAEVHQAGQPS